MLIKRINELFNLDELQVEFRKLGINLITGSAGALFFSKGHSHWLTFIAMCVMIAGIVFELLGLYRRSSNESK